LQRHEPRMDASTLVVWRRDLTRGSWRVTEVGATPRLSNAEALPVATLRSQRRPAGQRSDGAAGREDRILMWQHLSRRLSCRPADAVSANRVTCLVSGRKSPTENGSRRREWRIQRLGQPGQPAQPRQPVSHTPPVCVADGRDPAGAAYGWSRIDELVGRIDRQVPGRSPHVPWQPASHMSYVERTAKEIVDSVDTQRHIRKRGPADIARWG